HAEGDAGHRRRAEAHLDVHAHEGPLTRSQSIWPLYAAGFTTAFGAHAIAANLGGDGAGAVTSLLALGGLLALYDGAEVVLKPVFYVVADRQGWLWAARLGQGASASAFSPAASSLVSRLNPATGQGRAFGSYGFVKSVGYALGPLLGGVIVSLGGLQALFAV